MAVNLTAPFLLGQRFGPDMAERGWGRIINVTSQQAARAFGNSGGYGASKGGLAALTRSQSEAWAPSGVCCNSLCPGFVPTRLNAHVARDPERSAAMAARTMTGRNGSPEDFAGVAVFLASRASDYVTGQTLYVDGGFSVTLRARRWPFRRRGTAQCRSWQDDDGGTTAPPEDFEENIVDIDVAEEMRGSYLEYAYSRHLLSARCPTRGTASSRCSAGSCTR